MSDHRRMDGIEAWGAEAELTALDALMWRTERPPADSWTGVVVQLLDPAPDWRRFRKAHEWVIPIVPRFAQKVVEPLLPTGPPRWSADPDFDLDHHLSRVSLPAPGTMAQLLAVAEEMAVKPLDRARSPWRGLLVEGVEGGRSAYLLQAHHVIMDGAGATQLLSRVLATHATEGQPATEPAPPRPVVTATGATVAGVVNLLRAAPRAFGSVGASALRIPQNPAKAVRYAASMVRVARPSMVASPDLLTGGSRTTWRFGLLECAVDDLKRAGKAAGGTVNDAFVTVVLGGLRGYFERQGEMLGDIPISMPVSVRKPDDPMGGNRFTGAFFSAPSGIADPAKRIEAMRERVSVVRDEPALDFLNTVTPIFNLTPTPIVTAALSGLTASAALTTSSWRGLEHPGFMAGSSLERMWVFGPLPGTAMCAAMCTHVGTCCISINADGDVFTDPDALWASMEESLLEVLALAQV